MAGTAAYLSVLRLRVGLYASDEFGCDLYADSNTKHEITLRQREHAGNSSSDVAG